MPDLSESIPLPDEGATFENWEAEGCHVFIGAKHILTLNTPESSVCDEAYRAYIEDWISPDEFCDRLAVILRTLGASSAVLAGVEQERRNYRLRSITPPHRSHEELLREVETMR